MLVMNKIIFFKSVFDFFSVMDSRIKFVDFIKVIEFIDYIILNDIGPIERKKKRVTEYFE